MADKTKRKPDDPEQSRRFIEAARKAEADTTEEGADKALKNVTHGSGATKRKPGQ